MGKAEGIIERYLATQAKKHNYICYKFTSPGIRGVPDRILIGFGQTFFVETKSPVGDLRKQQEFRISEMQKHGATVYVVNSKESVDELFTMLSKINE